MAELFAWTDGACSGNPGPGGWGVLMRAIEGAQVIKERTLQGGEALTTNNRMELTAAICALEALDGPATVHLHTDSQYVQKGISAWIHNWKRNGWRTSDKKPVKNADLWQRLDELASRHEIKWFWVKGHAGHAGNERADILANRGMDELRTKTS